MPSFNIHLAIAKLYAEKNEIKDLAGFYRGNVDPDLTDNKDLTHYGATPEKTDVKNAWDRFSIKVDLAKFLSRHKLDSDYNRGLFLHLITDEEFFYTFYGRNVLESLDDDIYRANLYYSYGIVNPYLKETYHLDEIGIDKIADTTYMQKKIQQARDKIERVKTGNSHSPECIIDTIKLDKFIRKVAKVNLENTAKRVRIS